MFVNDQDGNVAKNIDSRDLAGDPGLLLAVALVVDQGVPARALRNRVGMRTGRNAGDDVTIELRDASLVPAKIVDESALGLALHVVEQGSLRPAQSVVVRRRGLRFAAVIRYVKSEAARARVGLKLYPD